jgi:hypothetical protein
MPVTAPKPRAKTKTKTKAKTARASTSASPSPSTTGARHLEAFLSKFDDEVADLARACLAWTRSVAPGALERVYDAYNALSIGFATGDSMRETFLHVAVYPRHVNIGFNQGAQLADPRGVLVGTGKAIRHVKIDTAARLDDPNLVKLVRAAAKQAGHAGDAKTPRRVVIAAVYARQRPRALLKPAR